MKNLKKYAKSDTGILIYAFNSDTVDYVKIADRTAKLAGLALNLPATLVTDQTADPCFSYDQIIRIDKPEENLRTESLQTVTDWFNKDRYRSYYITPYNTTIMIDADYLIFDDSLLKLLAVDFDYLLYKSADIDSTMDIKMGTTSIPFVWATVCMFRKSELTEQFFDLVGRVQRNYNYYRSLYNIREWNYRNDYAFTIADNILNGYTQDNKRYIPGSLPTISRPIESMQTDKFIKIKHQDHAIVYPMQNLHVLDKQYLLSDEFGQIVEVFCEST